TNLHECPSYLCSFVSIRGSSHSTCRQSIPLCAENHHPNARSAKADPTSDSICCLCDRCTFCAHHLRVPFATFASSRRMSPPIQDTTRLPQPPVQNRHT